MVFLPGLVRHPDFECRLAVNALRHEGETSSLGDVMVLFLPSSRRKGPSNLTHLVERRIASLLLANPAVCHAPIAVELFLFFLQYAERYIACS